MKNITLAIDDEVLDKARVIAAEQKTTINALVRQFLSELAGRDDRRAQARLELLRLMEESKARMVPGATFEREQTYER